MTSTTTYQEITPTRLYIKQHSITGLKYFGKTTQADPYKYLGSGKHWVRHYKKHGKQHIKTLWVSDFYYDTLIVKVALHFSEENKIVESSDWANLILENGLDGGGRNNCTPESIQKANDTREKNNSGMNNPLVYQKMLNTKKETGIIPTPSIAFLSIISTRKTYDKCNLSRWCPEFKQYY